MEGLVFGATKNTHKACSHCNRFLPRVLFFKECKGNDGHRAICKHCAKLQERARYKYKPHKSYTERLWFNANVVNESCWEWVGSKSSGGYGKISSGGRVVKTHRVFYEMFYGEIPSGLHVCHTCDNPSCVNPDHLFLGTHLNNIQDRTDKNRSAIGTQNGSSKLNDDSIYEIRKLYATNKYTYEKLAVLHNVSSSTIYRVVNKIGWKHLD